MPSEKKKLYATWKAILSRCLNPADKSFERYGGRGIEVCERWQGGYGFAHFLADMGERPSPEHSVDRINNDGNYCPENCRWANRSQQQRNTRATRWLEYQGQTKPLAEWAERHGIPVKRLRDRLKHGWSIEKALNTPITLSKVRR